jgi:hypothetical protein
VCGPAPAALAAGVLAGPARAGWSRPAWFASPVALDIIGPEAAVSPSKASAVAFSVQDEDDPANSSAFATWRSAGGRLSQSRQVPNAQVVLALAFRAGTLELLTGNSPAGQACCSEGDVTALSAGGRFDGGRRLVGQLAGATAGQLVPLGGGMLAAIATERGVWVSQAGRSGHFGNTRRLAGAGSSPQALQATSVANGGVVAWTSGSGGSGGGAARISVAIGSSRGVPRRARTAVRVPRRDGIDELGLAPAPNGATLAWVESWYDPRGNYHSELAAADLSSPRRTTTFAISGTIASGLTFAADARGDQVLAWKACTWMATCSVRAVLRPAGGRFAAPVRLGSIDASDGPAAAVAPSGEALIGWIDRGHVLASHLSARATRFSAVHTVSSTDYAANLTLAFAGGEALAAWSQGTFAPTVVGAVYRSR